MKIKLTESKLRKVVQSVLKENIDFGDEIVNVLRQTTIGNVNTPRELADFLKRNVIWRIEDADSWEEVVQRGGE